MPLIVSRTGIIAGALFALIHAVANTATADTFSVWSFQLPDSLVVTERTSTQIVIRLKPGLSGNTKITLFAEQILDLPRDQWLNNRWAEAKAGLTITAENREVPMTLSDGTPGVRRSARAGNDGSSQLQLDFFGGDGRGVMMLVETDGDLAKAAYEKLFKSLSLRAG